MKNRTQNEKQRHKLHWRLILTTVMDTRYNINTTCYQALLMLIYTPNVRYYYLILYFILDKQCKQN
jgi:hypothetical protein